MNTLLVFMTALFTSLGLVPVLRRWALTTGTVDTPDERKVHKEAIPRLGGVAIYISFLFSALVFIEGSREVRGILAGALVIFVVGLIDDLYGLSARRKFAGEIAGVLVTITVGHLYLTNLGNLFGLGSIVLSQWASVFFTIFAVVGVINAINLIDGLDGLSGGVSVIALASFALLAFHDGNFEIVALCAALLGAILGFLKYNLYPARIFMGDAGSLTVGFVLGFIAVFLTQTPQSSVSPMIPVVIMGLPILDAVWVMVCRIMKGGGPFTADMTHVHHKFLNLGFQHRFTVIVIYGISLFWALIAITIRDWPEYLLLLNYVVVSMACYGALRYLINHRNRHAFFAKDSSASLRETHTYKILSAKADLIAPMLFVFLVFYLLLAMISTVSSDNYSLFAGSFYLAAVVVVWLFKNKLRQSFLKMVGYLGGLVVAFLVERVHSIDLFTGFPVVQIEVYVFVLMVTLVIIKTLFRRWGEFFVSVPEVAILATGVFVLVAFSQTPELSHLSNVPIRGGVLFFAINIVFFNSTKNQRPIVGSA